MSSAPTASYLGRPALGDWVKKKEVQQPADERARLQGIIEEHYGFVWRTARWLGVAENDLDDVTQEVFWTATSRLADIEPGRERGFLFGVATRKAAAARRALRAHPVVSDTHQLESMADCPLPDEALESGRAKAVLREILLSMPEDLRVVFALFELEQIEIPEIAKMTGLPKGTVGSRLRRARESFKLQVRRMRTRLAFGQREG